MEEVTAANHYEQVVCFKCPECEFVSLDTTSVATHTREQHNLLKSYGSSPVASKTNIPVGQGAPRQFELLKCEIIECNVSMAKKDNLDYHIKSHFGDSLRCPECNEIFSKWKILTSHLWKIHKIDMELLSCSDCEYKTTKKELLNFHQKIHSETRSCLCDLCGKGFKNMKQLRNHKELHQNMPTRSSFKCDTCGLVLSNRRLLKAHHNSIHLKIRTHLCNFCGHNTSSQSNLKIHLRQHTGEKPFSCPDCQYRTADHNSLRRHRMKHTGEKRYKCPHCSYASIQSSTFKAHLKNKHPTLSEELIFSCKFCNFKTVRKDNLELHHASAHLTSCNT